jgi:hypothetical protein
MSTRILERAEGRERFAEISQAMKASDAVDRELKLFTTPAGFCEGMLGLTPYEWQRSLTARGHLGRTRDAWRRSRASKSANIIAPRRSSLCMAPGHHRHHLCGSRQMTSDLAILKHREVPLFNSWAAYRQSDRRK